MMWTIRTDTNSLLFVLAQINVKIGHDTFWMERKTYRSWINPYIYPKAKKIDIGKRKLAHQSFSLRTFSPVTRIQVFCLHFCFLSHFSCCAITLLLMTQLKACCITTIQHELVKRKKCYIWSSSWPTLTVC